MALPVPTTAVLQLSPNTAMLLAPYRCTHSPPPVLHFLLMQNLSPKDSAENDKMKLQFSQCHTSYEVTALQNQIVVLANVLVNTAA